ncbi:MAG: hypothetical protein M0Z66_01270 [Thermaerobacter sp.]|nr:hypothetical protein [Thermaerobacter sp.]
MGLLWIAALATVVIGGVLAWQLGKKYAQKHRPYALWWTVSFGLATLAALTQLLAFAQGGFAGLDYRAYLLFSAAVPGFMGAGTVYLIWRRFGSWFLGAIWVFTAVALVGAATTALQPNLLKDVLAASATVAKAAPGVLVTIGYALLGAFGGLALILGALYSYIRSRQAYNLLIALGGIVFSIADTVGQFGHGVLFFPAQILGMLLLYFGVAGSNEVAARQRLTKSA